MLVYLFLFLPLKLLLAWSRQIFKFLSDCILVIRRDSGINENEMVNVRRIWWRCNPRPLFCLSHISDISLHVDGGIVMATEYLWRQKSVYLHHIDDQSVTFVRMKDGAEWRAHVCVCVCVCCRC